MAAVQQRRGHACVGVPKRRRRTRKKRHIRRLTLPETAKTNITQRLFCFMIRFDEAVQSAVQSPECQRSTLRHVRSDRWKTPGEEGTPPRSVRVLLIGLGSTPDPPPRPASSEDVAFDPLRQRVAVRAVSRTGLAQDLQRRAARRRASSPGAKKRWP